MNGDPETPADGVLHALDPRWVGYRRRVALVRTVVYAVLLFGTAALLLLAEVPPLPTFGAAALIVAVIGAAGYAWPAHQYRYSGYRLTEHGLEIRTGALWRHRAHVPRSRIQHSDVAQGPLERRFGLGTLIVSTAGTLNAAVRLPGLDHARALAMRAHLMQADADDVV